MNKIPIMPTGHYVLVEDEPVEQVSESGVVIVTAVEHKREQKGQDIGRIVAFGPLAFKDVKGCDGPADWGVSQGDLVEYSGRYEGKESAFVRSGKDQRLRLIPDLSIVSKYLEDQS